MRLTLNEAYILLREFKPSKKVQGSSGGKEGRRLPATVALRANVELDQELDHVVGRFWRGGRGRPPAERVALEGGIMAIFGGFEGVPGGEG